MGAAAGRTWLRQFLSVSFDQPVGPRIATEGVDGYYIDMRVKAASPRWPAAGYLPLEDQLKVVIAQWGLGAYEHWLATGREEWLQAARSVCAHFVETQLTSGPRAGGWVHERGFPHSFPMKPGWLSGMAQGEAASLLVRVHSETGEDALAEAAIAGLRPLTVPSAEGGALVELEGGPFFEEYPTPRPSMVLNGEIFALYGIRDVAVAFEESGARRLFEAGLDALAAGIGRWDVGYWSRYDLYPHRLVNTASNAYHTLHIDQLNALGVVAPRPALREAEQRFRRYRERPLNRARAFASKVAFRLAVPR